MLETVDFGRQTEINSAKRQGIYTLRRDGKNVIITGRSPSKEDIGKGTILSGLPYGGIQGHSFVVKTIEHRPHRGTRSELFFWEAKCNETPQ